MSGTAPSFGRRLTQLAAATPDAIALHFASSDGHETSITWAELESRSNQVARLLQGRGLGQDDVAAIGLANSFEHVFATFGSWKLGAAVLPMRWDLPDWERSRLLDTAQAKVVLATSADESSSIITADELATTTSLPDDALPDRVPHRAKLIASSGSTGRPKIIETPQTGRYGGSVLRIVSDEGRPIALSSAPLYHVNGFMYCYDALLDGALVVLMERFDARRAVELIEEHSVEFATMVPTMLMRIARLGDIRSDQLASLKRMMYGGASIPEWVVRAWLELIPPDRFWLSYGGSEGIGLCMTDGVDWLARPGTCGKPIGCDVRILGSDLDDVPTGTVGEIYMRQHDAAIEPFQYIGAPTPPATADGFRTMGDMGYVDEDGYVFIVERRQDMIVTGGVNVFPSEIEAALSEHDGVADAVVVGVPDPEWGQRVEAVFRPHDPAQVPSEAELRDHCRSRLASYKVPKRFRPVAALPRTEAGKINRTEVAGSIGSPAESANLERRTPGA